MTLSQQIARHIPFSRARFSRALTGSREGGDAYALATLETLVAEQGDASSENCLRPGEDPKIALYRLLLDIPSSPRSTRTRKFTAISNGAPGAISRRSRCAPRIAFLLSVLEGFALEEVASTLDVSVEEAGELIAAANAEIAGQIATQVLIIEDEPLIALDLREVVEELGHSVVGVARTHAEALAGNLQDQARPDSRGHPARRRKLGARGRQRDSRELSTPVIFITAYPERFLLGEAPEPAFLIAKPFAVDALKAVISQALFFDRRF